MNERHLQEVYQRLSAGDREMLLAFAEFLLQREGSLSVEKAQQETPMSIAEPVFIERPATESVVAGLKRLSRTYPMLDKSRMLSATSELVAQHIMQGTAASEVINELEDIFREHYRQLRDGRD